MVNRKKAEYGTPQKYYTPKGGLVFLGETKTDNISVTTGCCLVENGYVFFCFILWGQIYLFFE